MQKAGGEGKAFSRGAEYREKFPVLSVGKFTVPRTLEGVPSTAEIGMVNAVDSKMRGTPGYVSVMLHGSTAYGLRKRQSDLDICMLFDSTSPGFNSKAFTSKFDEATSGFGPLWKIILGKGRRLDANDAFWSDLAVLGASERPIIPLVKALVFLLEVSANTKPISEYRRKAGTLLAEMPDQERRKVLLLVLAWTEIFEQGNFINMFERMPESRKGKNMLGALEKGGDMQKQVAARKAIWRKRMVQFYGLKETEVPL